MSHTESGFGAMRRLAGTAYFPLSALARLPLSMLVLGVLTYVSASADQLATAGAIAAIAGVGVAVGAPLSGAASDRWGQRVTLLTSTVLYCIALLWLLATGAPGTEPLTFTPSLAASAFVAGLVVPQCGPMTRVRWIRGLDSTDRRTLDTAQGYESTVDELGFVLGPAAVGLIAVLVGPAAPLWTALALTIALVPWFALHHTERFATVGRRTRSQRSDAPRPEPIAWGTITLLLFGMLSIGAVFGSLATATTAFAQETGNPGAGGVIYAAMGLTSGAAALSVSRWPAAWSTARRWLTCAIVLVPVLSLLWLAQEPWHLAVLLLAVGAPIGPVLVTVFSAAGAITPSHRLGLVMTLLSAGITLGTSIGNWGGGTLADTGGYSGVFVVTFIAGVAVLTTGILYSRLTRRQPSAPAPSRESVEAAS
ncbi:MFS transporter [Tessaracoccus caeni]|uniref:MFS transporter n=1 Tax=Tessaracoccus caeni TaxID=3031239 RepID=UPI0023DADBA6|nr:MFS transporter [Tessaracoccus caeni]MDF1489075.1 MFS transporter [Tessaracoccus caeni]